MASFYIRQNKKSWSLLEEKWANGIRAQVTVPKELYSTLGFRHSMTIEEARLRVKQLNKQKKVERSSAVAAARRFKFEEAVKDAFVDPTLAGEFIKRLRDENFGTEDNIKNLMLRWNTVSRIIIELRLEPHLFEEEQIRLFSYFKKNKFSFDYIRKLLRVFNLWGKFVCKHQGRHFEPVVPPKGHLKEKLQEAYLSKKSNRAGGAKGLTPKLLEIGYEKLITGYYEWLYTSFWFGLRPVEVDGLTDSDKWHLTVEEDGTKVLHVYQSKLVNLPKDSRWKLIPILYPEQEKALQFIKLRSLKRPLTREIRLLFGDGFGLYSGRKGFTDEMLDRGNPIEHVSSWLGHRTIEMTWRKYKNKKRVQYKKSS